MTAVGCTWHDSEPVTNYDYGVRAFLNVHLNVTIIMTATTLAYYQVYGTPLRIFLSFLPLFTRAYPEHFTVNCIVTLRDTC